MAGLMDMMGGMGGGGGGGYGGLIGGAMTLLGGILGGNQKGPQLSRVQLDPITKGQTDFLSQEKYLPGVSQTIQEANDLSNEMFKKNIAQFAPDVEQTNRQIGANAAAELAGKVPMGTGAGYNGRDLSARDLGLTVDDLMTSGAGMSNAALQGARALNPFEHGVTETLLSPSALLARDDSHMYEDNDRKNQMALIRSKASSINPIMSGITAAGSNLMGGMMGGMGGFG